MKNFSTSSMRMTGALKYRTAFHSVQLSGVMANRVCSATSQHPAPEEPDDVKLTVKNGMYRMAKWRAMLNVMAATRYGFFHGGNRSKLSFSDSEFMALNISTVTRMDKLIVVARWAITLVNI